MRPVIAIVLAVWCCESVGRAQDSPKEAFQQAVAAYEGGRFGDAASLFVRLLEGNGSVRYRSAGLLLASRCYQQLQYHGLAAAYARRLLREYPGSAYAGEARLVLARAAYAEGDYAACLNQLALVRDETNSDRSRRRVDSLLANLMLRVLTVSESQQVADGLGPTEARDVVYYWLAERYAGLERFEQSRALFRRVVDRAPKSRWSKRSKERLNQIGGKADGPVKIGLITSLTGRNGEMGLDIRRGVELALNLYNESANVPILSVVYDDQSDVVQAILSARDLATEEVSLIIGPIESEEMAAASVVANRYCIPIVSPTANKSDLHRIGPCVYEANATVRTRSAALAEYAVNRLGARRFAILAPSDGYGDEAIEAFTQFVEERGARVLAVERYYENTQDFRSQLIALRKIGFVDSVLTANRLGEIHQYSKRQIDSLYAWYFPVTEDVKEEYAIPVSRFDGLFLPVYESDIKYIAPQIAFYNIRTRLLGGDQWYEPTELKLQQSYVNGVVFVSGFHLDPGDRDVQTFRASYRKAYGREASDEAVFGFDLARLVARLVDEGARTSDRMLLRLQEGVQWKGLHNEILWARHTQSNQSVHILQFKDGVISRLNKP